MVVFQLVTFPVLTEYVFLFMLLEVVVRIWKRAVFQVVTFPGKCSYLILFSSLCCWKLYRSGRGFVFYLVTFPGNFCLLY